MCCKKLFIELKDRANLQQVQCHAHMAKQLPSHGCGSWNNMILHCVDVTKSGACWASLQRRKWNRAGMLSRLSYSDWDDLHKATKQTCERRIHPELLNTKTSLPLVQEAWEWICHLTQDGCILECRSCNICALFPLLGPSPMSGLPLSALLRFQASLCPSPLPSLPLLPFSPQFFHPHWYHLSQEILPVSTLLLLQYCSCFELQQWSWRAFLRPWPQWIEYASWLWIISDIYYHIFATKCPMPPEN